MKEQQKQTGTTKWFNNPEGYGFAFNESSEDVLIHYRAVMGGKQVKTLAEGRGVEFIQLKSEKGWQAHEILIMEEVT